MGVDEAALHHIVVSLLCILLVIEEEEVSCLVGVGEVDVQNHDGEDGEGSGHVFGTEISSYLTSKTNVSRPNLQSPYLPAPYMCMWY